LLPSGSAWLERSPGAPLGSGAGWSRRSAPVDLSYAVASSGDGCVLPTVDRARTRSAVCLTCHDGTVGATMHAVAGELEGHPIERTYEGVLLASGRLRARADLPAQLVLPEGVVACTTCHDGGAPAPSRLAVPMTGSALCLSCHPY